MGPGAGSLRVNRGGNWNNAAMISRSANRNGNAPDNRNNSLGFRLVSTGYGKDMNCPIRLSRVPRMRERTWPVPGG